MIHVFMCHCVSVTEVNMRAEVPQPKTFDEFNTFCVFITQTFIFGEQKIRHIPGKEQGRGVEISSFSGAKRHHEYLEQ